MIQQIGYQILTFFHRWVYLIDRLTGTVKKVMQEQEYER